MQRGRAVKSNRLQIIYIKFDRTCSHREETSANCSVSKHNNVGVSNADTFKSEGWLTLNSRSQFHCHRKLYYVLADLDRPVNWEATNSDAETV